MPMAGKIQRSKSRFGGFSLIELLIVLGLIIVMMTMLWGRSSRAYQIRQMSACEKNLQTILVALKTFSIDHNNNYPLLTNAMTSEPVLSLLIPRCTTGTEYFICPGGNDPALPAALPFTNANQRISYAYYMGHTAADGADQPLLSDRQIDTLPKGVGSPLFSRDGKRPGNNHYSYGGNVLFCDGYIQRNGRRADTNMPIGTNITLLNPLP